MKHSATQSTLSIRRIVMQLAAVFLAEAVLVVLMVRSWFITDWACAWGPESSYCLISADGLLIMERVSSGVDDLPNRRWMTGRGSIVGSAYVPTVSSNSVWGDIGLIETLTDVPWYRSQVSNIFLETRRASVRNIRIRYEFLVLIGPLLSIRPIRKLYLHLLACYRKRHGLCIECGYDLRASTERCPECGAALGESSIGTDQARIV